MATLSQTFRRSIERHPMARKALLGCGVASSVWWVAVDVLASRRYPGYCYTDRIISELSAEGAPTRNFLLAVNTVPYAALATAFGAGVWASTDDAGAGRITGDLLVGNAVIGAVGGVLFPMQMRENKGTLRNALHVPYGMADVLLFLLTMSFGSRLLGTRFRFYSYATIFTLLLFGVMTGAQSGKMVENQPTPWMGLEERVSVYATMLWFAVLSTGLLSAEANQARHTVQRRQRPRN